MKKIICLSLVALLGACTQRMTPLPTGEELRVCLTNEALTHIQDGSALASPIRITAKKMLNACKKAEEQTSEDKQLAQTILAAMMQESESQ